MDASEWHCVPIYSVFSALNCCNNWRFAYIGVARGYTMGADAPQGEKINYLA